MPVNEIEIPGTSVSFRVLSVNFTEWDFANVADEVQEKQPKFSVDPETAGFHDCDFDENIFRGFFSHVVPFEVERLEEGIVSKTLLKRIETCEFIALENMLFVTGKTGPQKILEHVLASLTGYGVIAMEFEFRHMSQFQERLTTMKSIGLTNPKDREIRRVKMTGKMETYEEYNVIDPKNHGIESVCGLIDSPLGPLTVTATRKGVIRLQVKRGFILTVECLQWILALIREEKAPQKNIAQPLVDFCKKSGCRVEIGTAFGKPVSIERDGTVRDASPKDEVENILKESGIPYEKDVAVKP